MVKLDSILDTVSKHIVFKSIVGNLLIKMVNTLVTYYDELNSKILFDNVILNLVLISKHRYYYETYVSYFWI